jgi:flagellar basal-body rod protein FlgB
MGEAQVFDRLDMFQMASGLARHAAARQAVVARNIANADTPGYRAQDIADFRTTWRQPDMQDRGGPRYLNARDLHSRGLRLVPIDAGGAADPNGNSVNLETEMLRGIEAQRAHSRALRIYGSALGILRTSLGR